MKTPAPPFILPNPSTTWKGTYRTVYFEIVRWAFESEPETPRWNYYISIQLDRLTDQTKAGEFWPEDKQFTYGTSWYTPHDSVPLIHDLDFHGGITFFEKNAASGNKRFIKVGCDYSHLWDEGREYDEKDIASDAVHTINLLMDSGEYLARCSGNGAFVPESEGVYERGSFYSNAHRTRLP